MKACDGVLLWLSRYASTALLFEKCMSSASAPFVEPCASIWISSAGKREGLELEGHKGPCLAEVPR